MLLLMIYDDIYYLFRLGSSVLGGGLLGEGSSILSPYCNSSSKNSTKRASSSSSSKYLKLKQMYLQRSYVSIDLIQYVDLGS